jgi:hypothetical protein
LPSDVNAPRGETDFEVRAVSVPARQPTPRPGPSAPSGAGSVGEPAPNLPGSSEWLDEHGIDPKVWAARGVWRYTHDDGERVKDLYRLGGTPNNQDQA